MMINKSWIVSKNIYSLIFLVFIIAAGIFFSLNNDWLNSRLSTDIAQAYALEDCNNNNINIFQCWEDKLNQAIKNDLDDAFGIVSYLYNTDSRFSGDCHGYVHAIGEAAYGLHHLNKNINISSKTSYCGYGFYHGFMETMLYTSGDFQEARDFCKYASDKLTGQTTKAYIACLHGIGHGAVDGGDPRAWGNIEAIISPGIQYCEALGETEKEKYLCATGIFNGLAIAFNTNQYGLKTPNPNDPYYVCHSQPSYHLLEACYEEMNTHAMYLSGNDFSRAVKLTESIENEEMAIIAIKNLSPVVSIYGTIKDSKKIEICRSLESLLYLPCIEGLVAGKLEIGRPGIEYLDGLEFCNNAGINTNEEATCFNTLIGHANILYPKGTVIELCKKIDTKYRNNCPKT